LLHAALFKHVQISSQVVRNALPADLAAQLLADLLQRSERYVRGQWFMFGQRHDAPRTSAYFNLREAEVHSTNGCMWQPMQQPMHTSCCVKLLRNSSTRFARQQARHSLMSSPKIVLFRGANLLCNDI